MLAASSASVVHVVAFVVPQSRKRELCCAILGSTACATLWCECVPISLCVGILFISYTVHMKYRPYLETNNTVAEDEWVVGQSRRLKYVSCPSPHWHEAARYRNATLLSSAFYRGHNLNLAQACSLSYGPTVTGRQAVCRTLLCLLPGRR